MYDRLDIADGSARSSTHSLTTAKSRLGWPSRSRLPAGTSPYKALTVSPGVARGSHAQPEAFDALLPPRYLALGDERVYGHVPKLDSSATCFVQSRTLVPTWWTSHFRFRRAV